MVKSSLLKIFFLQKLPFYTVCATNLFLVNSECHLNENWLQLVLYSLFLKSLHSLWLFETLPHQNCHQIALKQSMENRYKKFIIMMMIKHPHPQTSPDRFNLQVSYTYCCHIVALFLLIILCYWLIIYSYLILQGVSQMLRFQEKVIATVYIYTKFSHSQFS